MDLIVAFFLDHVVLIGVGGLGAALGIWCLFLRYKNVEALWARRLCLWSDALNTAFVSITVVGVLTVSFQLAISLPDVAKSGAIPAQVDNRKLIEDGHKEILTELVLCL